MRNTQNHQQKLLNFFQEFQDILNKNNLWYIAEFGTLLGAIREQKMIDWDDDIDLVISLETYKFLKEKYPKNILDTDVNGYPFLFAKWVPNVDEYLSNEIFIDLFIAIPTNSQRLNKFKSFKTIFRFTNQMFNKKSKYKPHDFVGKVLKFLTFFTQWTTKKISIENAINLLHESENPEFIHIMNLPIYPVKDILSHKRPLNIWEREKVKFSTTFIYVPKVYDFCLQQSYGKNYMTPIKTKNALVHIDTINAINISKYEKMKGKK